MDAGSSSRPTTSTCSTRRSAAPPPMTEQSPGRSPAAPSPRVRSDYTTRANWARLEAFLATAVRGVDRGVSMKTGAAHDEQLSVRRGQHRSGGPHGGGVVEAVRGGPGRSASRSASATTRSARCSEIPMTCAWSSISAATRGAGAPSSTRGAFGDLSETLASRSRTAATRLRCWRPELHACPAPRDPPAACGTAAGCVRAGAVPQREGRPGLHHRSLGVVVPGIAALGYCPRLRSLPPTVPPARSARHRRRVPRAPPASGTSAACTPERAWSSSPSSR